MRRLVRRLEAPALASHAHHVTRMGVCTAHIVNM